MKRDDNEGVIMEKMGGIRKMSKQANNCDKDDDRECVEREIR